MKEVLSAESIITTISHTFKSKRVAGTNVEIPVTVAPAAPGQSPAVIIKLAPGNNLQKNGYNASWQLINLQQQATENDP